MTNWLTMTSDEIRDAIGSMGADELEAYGLVRGPVDSEGVMWHSGDMSDTTWGVIEGIAYSNGEWYIRGHDMSAPWMEANSVRHHHEPTVQDIMVEYLRKFTSGDVSQDELAPVTDEYGARIREAIANA